MQKDTLKRWFNASVVISVFLWVAVGGLVRVHGGHYQISWWVFWMLPLQGLFYFVLGKLIYLTGRKLFTGKNITAGPWWKFDWFTVSMVSIGIVAAMLAVELSINPFHGSGTGGPVNIILLCMTAIPWFIVIITGELFFKLMMLIGWACAGLIVLWVAIHAWHIFVKLAKRLHGTRSSLHASTASEKEKQMSAENSTWESVKRNYLEQVEAELKAGGHGQWREIIDDVGGHLEQKFAELAESERTWENFQKIITEMGPASDYVELLGEKAVVGGGEKGIWGRFAVNAAVSILIIAAIIVMVQVVDWFTAPYYGKRVAVGEPNKPGEFAVSTIKTPQGRYIDKVKYPFADDPEVIGKWVSVDFVQSPEDFIPGQKRWQWDLWFKGITFYKGGTTNWGGDQWTKGLVLDHVTGTASRYTIKTIDGARYMFYEWKSGDYTILHRKPKYYVLKKEASSSAEKSDAMLPPAQLDANGDFIVETSTNEQGRFVDRLNYPFVNDAQVIGKWISVDFVQKPEDFTAGEQHWPSDLFLKNLYFFEGGTTGGPWTWTKGLVLHPGNRTAAKYTIESIDGQQYMFFEWKSGDYVIRHRKPEYYVLKKEAGGGGWASIDIKPSAFEIRLEPKRGVCNLVVSIQNAGEAVIGKFKLRYYRGEPNENMDEAGNVHGGWHEAGPIEAGKSWNERTRDFHLSDGEYEFNVVLDYDNAIAEGDESNNRASLKVKILDGQIASQIAGK